MKLKLKLYLLILGVLGSFFTFLWFRTINISTIKPLIFSWESFGYIALCCCFTFANLVLRWLRWYFLIRRNTHEIATRTGLLLYFATLPMILTPFCIGELIRVPLVRRGHHVAVGNLFSAWLIERANDVFILSTFWIFAKYGFNAGVSSFCAGFIITFLLLFFSSKKTPGFVFSLYSTLIVAVISLVSWILPVFALQFVVSGVSESLGFIEALDSFSHSTLLGGMSGVPVGISVTGSSLIELMQLFGIDDTYSILSVVIFRTGTAWFSVLLGILVLFVKRDSLADYLRRSDTSNHFDDIANEYEGQIPEHIRQRLLSKKVNVTEKCIAENAIRSGALGLDLGCGQGWYLLELAKKGYSMWGVDRSIEQLKNAVGNASLIGQKINTAQSDASELPFQSNTFDFVYSINVLHHITDPVVRAKVLTEIVRILNPAVFLCFTR